MGNYILYLIKTYNGKNLNIYIYTHIYIYHFAVCMNYYKYFNKRNTVLLGLLTGQLLQYLSSPICKFF